MLRPVMPTWRDLWRQRLRWQRGAIENLRAYGLNRVTLPYAVQQLGMGIGVIAMWSFVLLTVLTAGNGLRVQPLWLSVGLIFVAERVVTVRRRGARHQCSGPATCIRRAQGETHCAGTRR